MRRAVTGATIVLGLAGCLVELSRPLDATDPRDAGAADANAQADAGANADAEATADAPPPSS